MKPAALLGAFLVAGSASGQGLVNFANTGTTLIYTQSTVTGLPGLTSGANAFKFGLYVGPLGTPAASLQLVGLATNAAPAFLAGLFNGGRPFQLPSPAYPAGTPISFQVRGWDFNVGTWENALIGVDAYGNGGAMRGVSAVGFVTPTDGSTGVPDLLGTGPGQVGGFTMTIPIPEPSVLALGVLGIAVLLFTRGKERNL